MSTSRTKPPVPDPSQDKSASAPLTEQDFLYRPISFSVLFNEASLQERRRLLILWLMVVLANVGVTLALRQYIWTGISFRVGENTAQMSLFIPAVTGTLLTFWLGGWWGGIPMFAGMLTVALSFGFNPIVAVLIALATSMSLVVLALAYRNAPVPFDLRSTRSLIFFLFIAYFAAMVGSSAAFIWAQARGFDVSRTFRFWQSWWIRGFIQAVVVTLPLLWMLSPRVIRWKKRLAFNRPWLPPTTNDIGIVFGLMLFVLSLFILGGNYLARLNLKAALIGVSDQKLIGLVTSAAESLSLLEWVSFGFVLVTGYFGWQMAMNWTQSLRDELTMQVQLMRESEDRYRLLFEINPQPLCVADRLTLQFLAVNGAMTQHYGWSREELLRQTLRTLHLPEDGLRLMGKITSAKDGINTAGLLQHQKKDGSSFTAEVMFHPLNFAGQEAILVQMTDVSDRQRAAEKIRRLNDYLESSVRERTVQLDAANGELRREIGERQRAEDDLRRINHTLETLIESSPVAIITVNAEEQVTRWNQAAEALFGWNADEVLGRAIPLAPLDKVESFEQLQQAVRLGDSFTGLELKSRKKDGGALQVSLSIAPLKGNHGQFNGCIGILSDITQRKEIEEELRNSEERYRSLFDGTPLPVWVYDEETLKFLMVNEAAIRLYGYSREEFAAMTLRDLRPGDGDDRNSPSGNYLSGSLTAGSWRHRKKDGAVVDVEISSHEVNYGGREARLIVANDVSKLQQAMKSLQAGNQTLETLIQASPLAIIMLDRDGSVQVWNAAAENMFGWSDLELIGHSLPFEDESALEAFRSLHEIVIQGVAFNLADQRVRTQSGTAIDISVSAAPVRDTLAQINGVMAVIADITERKRAEEKIRESEERYRDLFENANDLIQSASVSGKILYVNQAWLRTLGYSREEVMGQNILKFIDPAEHDHCREGLNLVRQGMDLPNIETVFVTKDGRKIVVEGNVNCRFEDGRPVSTRAIFRDITSRKQAEEELRASEARTRAIIENMLTGLILADERGLIRYLNPAAEKLFGFAKEEIEGQPLSVLLAEGMQENWQQYLRNSRPGALEKVTEWQGRRNNGGVFPLELSYYEFDTPEGHVLAGNVRDLSERHEVDRLKKEFVSTVSHELRTPLTSIRGSLTLLTSGAFGEIPAEAVEMLNVANRNTLRLIALINDILDLERMESGRIEMRFEVHLLAQIIERAFESVSAFAQQQQIQLRVEPVELAVLADEERLIQVLVNLLSNAIKFSPAGNEVVVSAASHNGWVEVRVQDFGRGIPAQFQEKIFERFRQVEASDSRQKGGTGLGLAICRNIIEAHRGSIGVESEEGKGSTFWFRLPASTKILAAHPAGTVRNQQTESADVAANVFNQAADNSRVAIEEN